MPINPLSVPNFSVTPYSGGADFSQLANLGNVYQEGQMQNRKLSVLGQLGNDPMQNSMLMIKSGVPELAQQGMNLMNQVTQQQRYAAQQQENIREFDIQQQGAEAERKLAREKFEADDPDTRQEAWLKGHPGGDVNSPQAQAYIYKQPQLLRSMMPAQIQKRYLDNQAALAPSQDVLDNLEELKILSPKATSGGLLGAGEMKLAGLGPYAPEMVKNTQRMQTIATMNVLQQVRTLFPGRVLQSEFKTLEKLEHPEQYSDDVRQTAYDHLAKIVKDRVAELQHENDQIDAGKLPGMSGGGTQAAGTGAPVKAEGGETTLQKMPDRIRNQAKAALIKKDAAAVRKKLIDEGYDPEDIGK
jgi:hypothetical protein